MKPIRILVMFVTLLFTGAAHAITLPDSSSCTTTNGVPCMTVTQNGTGTALNSSAFRVVNNQYGIGFSADTAQGTAVYSRSANGYALDVKSQSNLGARIDSAYSTGLITTAHNSANSAIYAQNDGGGYAGYFDVPGNGGIAVQAQNLTSSGWALYVLGPTYLSNGYSSSDIKLKTDVTESTYGLKEVLDMKPSFYAWKTDANHVRHVGFIAQDMQKLIPDVVKSDDKSGTLAIDYSALVPVLAKAIAEEHRRNTWLYLFLAAGNLVFFLAAINGRKKHA